MITRDPPRLQPYPRSAPRPQDRALDVPASGRCFTSEELFAGATEIAITHDGAVYRMKITRQGKLILNK